MRAPLYSYWLWTKGAEIEGHCTSCGYVGQQRKITAVRILSVFRLPIFPTCLHSLQRCEKCKETYCDKYEAGITTTAVRAILIYGVHSGGTTRPATARSVHAEVMGRPWSNNDYAEDEKLWGDEENIGAALRGMRPYLSTENKGRVLRAALLQGAEDGKLDEAERRMILSACDALGFSLTRLRSEIEGLISPEPARAT